MNSIMFYAFRIIGMEFIPSRAGLRLNNAVRLLLIPILLLPALFGCNNPANSAYDLAVAAARKGGYEQARLELEKAASLDSSSAKICYGKGAVCAYLGMLEESRAAFNQALELDSDCRIAADANQLQLFEEIEAEVLALPVQTKKAQLAPFEHGEITRKSFSLNEIKCANRIINYKKIADSIIEGYKSDEEKLLALLDWTYRNISFMPESKRDFNALPIDIMLRGYGACDRSAWVFISLAEQAGYPGNLFFLHYPGAPSDSPHTVALIYLQGKWIVFDTLNGIVFRNQDGKSLAGLDDIINTPSLTHICAWYNEGGGSRCFEHGEVGFAAEAEASLPRMQVVQQALDKFSAQPPKVYQSLYDKGYFAIKTLANGDIPARQDNIVFPFKCPGKTFEIRFWALPFALKKSNEMGLFEQMIKKVYPAFDYYKTARQSFLIGDYRTALSQFAGLLKASPDTKYLDDMRYFECLCYFNAQDYRAAIEALRKYFNDYPQGQWSDGAEYHLARSYEAAGLYQEALGEYQKVKRANAITNVQQRIKNVAQLILKNEAPH